MPITMEEAIKNVTTTASEGFTKIYENPEKFDMSLRRQKVYINPSKHEKFDEALFDMIKEVDQLHDDPSKIYELTPTVAFAILMCLFQFYIPEGTEKKDDLTIYYDLAGHLQKVANKIHDGN